MRRQKMDLARFKPVASMGGLGRKAIQANEASISTSGRSRMLSLSALEPGEYYIALDATARQLLVRPAAMTDPRSSIRSARRAVQGCAIRLAVGAVVSAIDIKPGRYHCERLEGGVVIVDFNRPVAK